MKKLLWIALLAAALLLGWRYRPVPGQPKQRTPASRPVAPVPKLALGEKILAKYLLTGQTVQRDLDDISHLLQSYRALVKTANPLPLGSNEEIAAALMGKNPHGEIFLPKGHRAFNAKGQIVDRWGGPLFFHALAADRMEIRSAGPDGQMWTEDDVERGSDGRFRQGRDSLRGSLYPPPIPSGIPSGGGAPR